jgi:formylglycine-generating enzyme required for sulfatase activity
MGIEKQSQHMIVVYTKSDEIKVAVPEFERFLEREPGLRDYLDQQRPATLADPHAHLRQLADISSLLENFTWSELNAGRFIHVAKDWFASVSYTVVSSLGAAPEENPDEKGNKYKRLTVRMSPRGVADPLLYVLAKSIKEPQPQLPGPTPPDLPTPDLPTPGPPDWRILAITGGAAIIILIVLITLLAWAFSENGTNQNGSNNGKPNNNTKPSAKVPAPSGMVYVPGGEFIMGNASGDDFERPTHRTLVKPFFIDLYEVTCADYARFVEQTGHAPPPGWRNGQYPQGSARHPVAGVSWDDAVAYAQWANKRLPTEAEWEFAARGTEGRLYPWGNQWLAGMANAGSGGGPADVGVFKGVSPFGVYDMAGNVWEWTADDLRPYPGGQLPPVSQGILKVIRGGSWQESPGQASTTYRGYLLARGSKDYSATGLRCAQDATGTQGSGTDSSAR